MIRLTLTISIAMVLACSEPPPIPVDPHYETRNYEDPSDELYDMQSLPRFDLELSGEALTHLKEEPRKYTHGSLLYRGETVANIGIRLKGEYSFRPIDEKPGFKLKFDKFEKGQRFKGLKRMTLNNNIQDPSFLSQSLSYAFFREVGLPAPRANNALLYVNGDFYGVYSNVETEDKVFLSRWFDSNDGNLYEENEVDFVPGAASVFDLETNKDINDRSGLEALISALDASTPDTFLDVVGQQLDIDHYLDYVAVEALIGGEDGYSYGTGSRNNFRIYRDPSTDKFVFLPWGLDRGLRPRVDPLHIHGWITPVDMYQSPWDAYGLLLDRCIESVPCQDKFVDRLKTMTRRFEEFNMGSNVQTLTSLIQEGVYADFRKEEDNDYFEYSVGLLNTYISGRPQSILNEI